MKNLLINRALAAGTKKLFILLFALVAGAGTLFASDTQVNGIWYDFDSSSKSATVTYRGSSYSAYSDEYTGLVAIPASVTYNNVKYSVTSIGSSAFMGCSGLTYVAIPDSVITSIGSYAFSGCSSLTYVEIPNSVTSIGLCAFRECTSMTAVPLQNSITSIGSSAFQGCSSLTSVTIPNSVTSISNYTFQSCTSLTSVRIPNSVTSIGMYAFYGCRGLTSIEIPSSVTRIGANAFYNCTGLTSVYISDIAAWCAIFIANKEDNPLYYAHKLYLNYKLVTELVIPSSVTSIGNYAFYTCTDLTSVTIPNSVTSIGVYAFRGCSGLTSVTIPSGVTSILEYAFSDCYRLTSVKIPSSVTSIGDYAFCYVPNIVYSGSASGSPWGARCVNGYVDGYLIYSDSTKTTLKACFASAQGQIVIPSSVTSIGDHAFRECTSVTSVTIPNSVTSIGSYAFCDCKGLTSIEIPSSVTSIGVGGIFSGCSGLTFVKIPSSVTRIVWSAFNGCTKLSSIVCEATTPPTLVVTVLDNLPCSGITVYVPANSVSKYKSDVKWKEFNIQSISYYTITWKNWDGTTLKTEQIIIGMTPTYTGTTPTRPATAQYTYKFKGWTPAVVAVTGNATYKATFTATKNKYLITFRDENGTELKSEEVEYGVMPIAPADPTKESTAQYDYTFAGWTPAVAIVTQAATYTATYTSALREYLVTFLNEDNTVISSKNYKYGETPIAPADPVKQNTAEYTYTFNGWDNAIAQVQGPQTYKATFTASKNSYTITWQNEDGSLIDQTIVEYGQIPAHANPVKQNTAEYTYTFAGWTPAVVAVTGDATYKATFTATKNKYLITFRDENGTELKSEEVEYGVMPIAPADPTKESTAQYDYTFAGWTPTITIVTQAATYTATYTSALREYLVTFLNEDNTVISSKNYKYGETPVAPADPIKQNTAEYTYTFNGWDNAIAQVQGPQTYKATYTATKNSYTITWQNEDGSLIDQTIVEYGQVPAHADPIKQNTAEYTYTFSGWTPAVVAVTGDATYKATFTATKNSYTITWQDENGTLIDQTIVEYGQIPAHANPVKQNTAEYTYTFAGWTPAVVAVTGNATYKATFTATKNSYTITWQNEDGLLIDQTTVEYGVVPTHTDPIKQNTAEYTYTFSGWTPVVVAVTGDATYKATFTATKNSYTITWQNEDGSLIDQTTVEYGVVPTHTDPVKQNTAEYTYTFAGWTPTVVAVTGNATYRATFSATKNKYLITFRNDDGTVLKNEEVEYGMLPIAPATPTKESTAQYNYEFAGWTPSVTLVSQAATYTATYNASVREYLVTFLNDDNSIISMQSCKYGSYPTIPSTPTKQATAEFSYTFAGWTPSVVAVTGDAAYTATFTATKNSYTITWQNEDGSLIDQTTVEYGIVPTHADPIKQNTAEYTYTFAGWTPAVEAVTSDATYKATFSSVVNVYTISVSAVNGQVIGGGEYQYGATIDLTAIPNEGYVFDQWSDGVTDNPRTITVTGDVEYTALFKSAEGLENIYTSEPVQKVIIDQKVFILRGEKVYTLQGQEVK